MVEDRRNRLLELIRQRGFATLPDLTATLRVSESTVRRDLDYLEETGVTKRTHGGVVYTGPSPKLAHFDQRQALQLDKKRSIARAASQLIEDNDTVVLDGGTTTYELGRLLVGRPLQVVTNSLPVANLFTASDSADLVLLGGYVHTRTGVSMGQYANQMLGDLSARRAVISVAGITSRGYFNSHPLLVETERAMIHAADEVIVVADSTKFGRSSLALLGPLDAVDVLVVDQGIEERWREEVTRAGVRLVVAEAVAAGEAQTNGTETDVA